MRPRSRRVLTTATLAHVIHDGFSDVLYVLFPVWAREFHLAYAQIGVIKALYAGGMALFQMLAGFAAERRGERGLLVAGTALTACGYIAAAGWAGGFASLVLFLLIAGAGSGVQHPLASSLVSKAYETGARRAALGTYNFSGDLGKIIAVAAVSLAVAAYGWRAAAGGFGAVGLVVAALIGIALSTVGAGGQDAVVHDPPRQPTGWGIHDYRGFWALTAIGFVDSGTRAAFLTFLPFALVAKGTTAAGVGAALVLIFAGGAVGKLVCGLLADRIGVIRTVVITEAATTVGIVVIVLASLPVALAALIPVGIALNGTSSVLYATVADLVVPERRSRAYGLFYSVGLGASALMPLIYGVIGDLIGISGTLALIAAVVLVTIPLCPPLRRAVTAATPTV